MDEFEKRDSGEDREAWEGDSWTEPPEESSGLQDSGEVNPFREADLDHALDVEQSNDQEDGWKLVSKTETAEVWRKSVPGKPVYLIKSFFYLPGISPQIVLEMINNLELRRRWDRQFPMIDVLEEHPTHRIVYWLVKMPPAMADRDLVQCISQKTDENTNTTTILYRNAKHPSRPKRSGIVRAETIFSSTIIRPDSQDPNSTRMSILLQLDLKGWIPYCIVNLLATRAPRKWRDSLFNFYQNVYLKELQREVEEGYEFQFIPGCVLKRRQSSTNTGETGGSTHYF